MSVNIETNEEFVDLDEILGTPSASSVIVPEEKTTVFSKDDKGSKIIDQLNSGQDDDEDDDDSKSKSSPASIIDDLIKDENEDKPKKGSELSSTIQKLIEDEVLFGFEDDKPFEEYTSEDFKELIQANIDSRLSEVHKDVPKQFFEAQPQEIQMAMKYVADGGRDLKSLFTYLSKSEEIKELSLEKESDQEEIIRTYLQSTNFGTVEDIEEEIETWKDLGKLEEKAGKFKPKLDKMQEQIVNHKLAEQEQKKMQHEKMVQSYKDNVFETLKKGNLNGLDLDKTTQSKLFAGLIQPNYPSITGNNTNLLGHLLEKYQFIEPKHDLIAEALWLLSDPEGYRGKIKEKGSQAQVETTVKKLKNLESNKNSGSPDIVDDKKRTLKKQGNIFSRD